MDLPQLIKASAVGVASYAVYSHGEHMKEGLRAAGKNVGDNARNGLQKSADNVKNGLLSAADDMRHSIDKFTEELSRWRRFLAKAGVCCAGLATFSILVCAFDQYQHRSLKRRKLESECRYLDAMQQIPWHPR